MKKRVKGLTIGRIASASLRAHKRSYAAMAAGILLSIFFVSTLCQCAWGVWEAALQRVRASLGNADVFVMDSPEWTDDFLLSSGDFESLGHISLTARTGSRYIGFFDETAAEIMNRRCLEGRMPEGAGELAAEQSYLDYLSIDAALGEEIEITLTPIDGLEETRVFTLVGILSEQSAGYDWAGVSYSSQPSQVYGLPSALCSEAEAPFDSGRTALERVMTLKKGVSLSSVLDKNWTEDGSRNEARPLFIGLSDWGDLTLWQTSVWGAPSSMGDDEFASILTMLILLGVSLLLACCVGIAAAMEGQLARKREEIGMLRAVGATKKQIRRLFGREAWLMALVLAPAALILSCLATWGMSRINSDVLIFSPRPVILIPIALISGACILLSASLPLRRAAQVMPAGVLRDTALLRRMGHVKSRTSFKPARLIAWRQNRLHPMRPLGAGMLTALMMICVIAALSILFRTGGYFFKSSVSFSAYFYSPYMTYNDYYTAVPERALSDSDVRQIESMQGVTGVSVESAGHVNVIMDSVPQYLTDAAPEMYCSLWDEEEFLNRYADSLRNANSLSFIGPTQEDALLSYQQKRDTRLRVQRETQHEDAYTLPMSIAALDEQAILKLADTVTDGKIDIQALNEGREVLVCVPDVYVEYMIEDGQVVGSRTQSTPFEGAVLEASNNGDFSVDQALQLMLLTVPDSTDRGEETKDGFYAGLERVDANVNVGAVLNTDINLTTMYENTPIILTTNQGLRALGISQSLITGIKISTDSALSEAEEQALSSRIKSILRRADNMSFYDQLQSRRDTIRQNRMYMLALVSVTLLFFAVAVSMMTGDVTRRIRSDTRMIGTLRAVGADAATVARCYRMQIVISLALGMLLSAGALAYISLSSVRYAALFYVSAALSIPLFAVLGYGACMLSLKGRIRETVSRSIVENIRDM